MRLAIRNVIGTCCEQPVAVRQARLQSMVFWRLFFDSYILPYVGTNKRPMARDAISGIDICQPFASKRGQFQNWTAR
jgi:hypothetical protein